jgi:signal transduction histidine kinase
MGALAVYLIYGAAALRGAAEIAAKRDPTLTILLLGAYGLLLITEPLLSSRLGKVSARLRNVSRAVYLLAQMGLILAMLVPGPSPDTFIVLFIPLGLQAVLFFGWRAGRWWIASFLVPMMIYVVYEEQINNLVMAVAFEGACFLAGALADMMQKAQAGRAENQRMALELANAQEELKKYVSQVEELARERARTELSRELHDSVTQTVFSMNLAVQTAQLTLVKQPGRAEAQLGRVVDLANSALGEIQKLVGPLEPQPQGGQSLESELERLVDKLRRSSELDVCLEVQGHRELPETARAGLANIVQEALTNVKKHAGTAQARVRLDQTGRPAWLEVEDTGKGFDQTSRSAGSGHMGMAEMAERAREIGWRLVIDSQPGRGTRVRVEEDGERAE